MMSLIPSYAIRYWLVAIATVMLTAPFGVARADLCAIVVDSTPAGAHVFIDDRYFGRAPFALQYGFPLNVKVKVLKEGHKKWEREVAIPLDQVVQIKADLEPGDDGSLVGLDFDSLTPKLRINSKPDGAMVYVNGEQVGTTPVEMVATGMPPDVQIQVKLDGYRPWIGNARVPLDIEYPIDVNLMSK